MKILIVDDHAMIRGGVKALCGDATVLEADTGMAALGLLQSERPQLVVLDLNMPGLSGLELLRQMLEADGAARILVFSMHGEAIYASRALSRGGEGLCQQECLAGRIAYRHPARRGGAHLCGRRDRAATGRAVR